MFVGRTTLQNFIARAPTQRVYSFPTDACTRACCSSVPRICIETRRDVAQRLLHPTLSQACEKNVCVCVYVSPSTFLPVCLCGWACVCLCVCVCVCVCTITLHRVLYPFLICVSPRNRNMHIYIYICYIHIAIVEKRFRYNLPSAGRRSYAGYTCVTDGIAVGTRVLVGWHLRVSSSFSLPSPPPARPLPPVPPAALFFVFFLSSFRYPFPPFAFVSTIFPPRDVQTSGLPGGKGRV